MTDSSVKTESDKKEEFKNDRVQFVAHRKPFSIVEYEAEASPDITAEAYRNAIKAIGKEVVFPGFRKGKAPDEVVIKRYSGEIDKKWQDLIANATFKECDNLAKIPLIRRDATVSYKMHKYSKEGAKLTLTFETVPTVPSIDPKNFQLKAVDRPEVNDEKIDETIRQTRFFFASWKPITDRPIQEGDFIIIDMDVIEEEPHQRLFSNTRFEVTDHSMAKWMKELVLGKKVGDSVEGISIPEDPIKPEDQENYKPKKVRIRIKTIEEATPPPLDDQFARQLGVETAEELRERIKLLLNKQADEHVREKQREQVTEFLLQQSFDIPRSVIERETQFRMQQIAQDPQFQNQWQSLSDKERKDFVSTIMTQADKAVRIFYLCRKIVQDAQISISDHDIPAPITDPLEALLKPGAPMHSPNEPDVKQAEAFSRVILERAEDWIIEQSQAH